MRLCYDCHNFTLTYFMLLKKAVCSISLALMVYVKDSGLRKWGSN